MPIYIDELTNDDPVPVKPETNEYEALSFLLGHREYGFAPSEIAAQTDSSDASASKTMARLFETGLVERSNGTYYVAPDHAETLTQRLNSLDAAVHLFESAPVTTATQKMAGKTRFRASILPRIPL
ncbi:MAG: helix-turn-helix domain-containing protein [Halolamina sp.]